MVKLRFIILDGVLVLRISENKKRYYRRVGHLLVGNPNLEKHWDAKKERFSCRASSYTENNKVLDEFRDIFWKLIQEHPELSAKQVANFYKAENTKSEPAANLSQWSPMEYQNSVSKYMEVVVIREKAKVGCNFEAYYKLLLKCKKVLPGFDDLPFSMLDYNKMISIAYTLAGHRGYKNITKTFRAFLGKAHKDPTVNFRLTQIGDFSFKDYDPDRYDVDDRHPDVLSDEQLRMFLNWNVDDITPKYINRSQVELYYDFCVFMFHSFFAPCDVIKLKWKDITNRNTLLVRRKKTHRSVEVPITPVMRTIINKYKGASKDRYIFPIMDDELEKKYTTKDYLFKNFREKLNIWLKEVGKALGTEFNMYAYVFRHTAITVAINNGVPISYISNTAGTSVEMIQNHYYNGESEQNREFLTSVFMKAGA